MALALAACSGSTAAVTTPDAAVAAADARAPADAPLAADAGSTVDAPLAVDAESRVDAGSTVDAGLTVDAAVAADAGAAPTLAIVATFLGGLLVFTVEPGSGALIPTAESPYLPHGQLYAISRDPSGRFVYTVDVRANAILGFRTTPGSTVLTPMAAPVATGTSPVAIAVDPLARFVYLGALDAEASLYVYKINPTDGSLTPAATASYQVGSGVSYVAPDPAGRFVYVQSGSGIHVYAVDDPTGHLAEIDHSPFTFALGGALVFHPSGAFLYNGGGALNVFAVDPDSGGLHPVMGSPFTTDVGSDPMAADIALDSRGRFLYAVHVATGHLSGFAIEEGGAKLVPVPRSPYDVTPLAYSVAVDPSGAFVYVGNDDTDKISGYSIDPTDGSLMPVEHSPFTAVGLQPEMIFVK